MLVFYELLDVPKSDLSIWERLVLVRLAFLCVLQLTLNSNVFAQDIVTDCDKYAASETDPNAKAPGVLLERVNAALAVPACTAAVRQSPNNAQLLFQLGRAYQTDNKLNLALEYFRKAAEKNYAAAQVLVTCTQRVFSSMVKAFHQTISKRPLGIVGPLSKDCRQRKANSLR